MGLFHHEIFWILAKSAMRVCKWASKRLDPARRRGSFILPLSDLEIWKVAARWSSERLVLVSWLFLCSARLLGWAGLGWWPQRRRATFVILMARWKWRREPRLEWDWDRLQPSRRHIWNVDVIIVNHFSHWLHTLLISQVVICKYDVTYHIPLPFLGAILFSFKVSWLV